MDGLDDLHAQLSARGVQIVSPPRDQPWEMREFGIRTPDGHRIMFGQPIL